MPRGWATFDCYGTLIDWDDGIASTLAHLWPRAHVGDLLARYHEVEPQVQAEDPGASYRDVLARALRRLADEASLELAGRDEGALGEALPDWRAFPDVAPALARLRDEGWQLAILSNTDPDLLAASVRQIGVPFDELVTARDIGSYKPAHEHWLAFFDRVGGRPEPYVHVAASPFHDLAPAARLGIPVVWINRRAEATSEPRVYELPTLDGLAGVLRELAEAGRGL